VICAYFKVIAALAWRDWNKIFKDLSIMNLWARVQTWEEFYCYTTALGTKCRFLSALEEF
jgi:hypothetical protein